MALAVMLVSCAGQQDQAVDFDKVKAEMASEEVIGQFFGMMQREMLAAMAEGGPTSVVGACRTIAPHLADSLSQLPGLTIGRVAMKIRNPQNAPDDFETAVLQTFASSTASAPDIHSEVVSAEGEPTVFRYMKEIIISERCLRCHGDPAGFSDSLQMVIAENYPDDQATGYSIGDSRGAFTVTLTYPEAKETVNSILAVEESH